MSIEESEHNSENIKRYYYNAPIFQEKKQFVPIVVKNKDSLISYIYGFHSASLFNEGLCPKPETLLSSFRFNDITETGESLENMSLDEIKEYTSKLVKRNSDRILGDLSIPTQELDMKENRDVFLKICCPCGMSYDYYSLEEFSKTEDSKSESCWVCGRLLIDYTGVDDGDIVYRGFPQSEYIKIINSVRKKMDVDILTELGYDDDEIDDMSSEWDTN